ALKFLGKEQESFGGWYGRWGVNYIYGTWSVLMALKQLGEDMSQPSVRKAVAWLKSCQNPDKGWGESCYTYNDPTLAGQGASTASQTAWALLGLMAAGEINSFEVQRGIDYLIKTQTAAGGWDEKLYTGTGFPRVFYLRYHGYSRYFPLWAIGVYRRLRAGRATRQDETRLDHPFDLSQSTDKV
ncbi:MAG: squalene--hopene cyclase, partial [Deltaproteobacteria bacterium]|nr:squalene--hopene cyclase [Deltaproteobacteria bacterium]